MILHLAYRTLKHPRGVIKDILVKVGKFIFLVDFLILDMDEDKEISIILKRPFIAIKKALIDVHQGELRLHV